eukprot:77571_1
MDMESTQRRINGNLKENTKMITTPNGYKFEGEYKDGERNGDGKIIWSDGDTFVGTWVSNGNTFVGTLVGGKMHGHGIYTKKNKWKFEGEYKDDERNGDGKII